MKNTDVEIRTARPEEFGPVGQLMVAVYSQLEGFPKPGEQPAYYKMLANIGDWTVKPGVELLVAVSAAGGLAGAVVYFADLDHYGAGGEAVKVKNASGFRLLAVSADFRGKGIGKLLTQACIAKASALQHSQVLIHSTEFMKVAWKMYEGIGFVRASDLDFMQGSLPVYGFRLKL